MDFENLFNTPVERLGAGNLKPLLAPENIRRAGVVSFCGAEFDFPTCPAFSRGVAEAAERGLFGFTLQDEAYNERVAWWLREMRGFMVQPEEIIPTHGTIFALATAIRLLVRPGENLVVLLPGYDRYKQAADRIGRGTVFCRLRDEGDRYALDWEALEACLHDPANRLLVLCQPNNPTGTIFSEQELRRLAALAAETDTAVFSDEIFAEISLTGERITPFVEAAGADVQAMTCTSLGKCMSLTGVNHANLIIRNPALRERYRAQRNADHFGSIDPMLYCGLMSACTAEGAAYVRALGELVRRNAAAMTEGIRAALPGARIIPPQGTYVLWVDYSGTGLSDDALEHLLTEEALFYGSDGRDYGATAQFRRYNLTVPPRDLRDAMQRLQAAAARYKKEESR